MNRKPPGIKENPFSGADYPQPHQRTVWLRLSPFERLKRVLVMRQRLKNAEAIHDKKIFPQP